MNFEIKKISPAERSAFQSRLRELEHSFIYPYGSDCFRIDHGKDYFRFFDRLGELTYYVVTSNGTLCGVAAAILRDMPYGREGRKSSAWYLCDLKVHPDFRGHKLTMKIFRKGLLASLLKSRRGFAVTMNSVGPNRIVKMMENAPFTPLGFHSNLDFFTMSAEETARARTTIESERGPLSFLTLQGVKDLVLSSTSKPLPLSHIQFGPMAQKGSSDPIPNHQHMIAAPQGDLLGKKLIALGVKPDAQASIMHFRMPDTNFRYLLTSDI
jgi:hypothetical protein